jgi:hypothetical protein
MSILRKEMIECHGAPAGARAGRALLLPLLPEILLLSCP